MFESFTAADVAECRGRLLDEAGPERVSHSAGVAAMLMTLHPSIGPNAAGVLAFSHDLTHRWSSVAHLELIGACGAALEDGERELPPCLHAVTGAIMFAKYFPDAPEGFVEALRRHTILKPGVSELTLALFVADKIEAGRKFISPEFRERVIMEPDCKLRALMVLRDQERFLKSVGGTHLPCTFAFMRSVGATPGA